MCATVSITHWSSLSQAVILHRHPFFWLCSAVWLQGRRMWGARWCDGTGRPPKGAAILPLHYFLAFNFFVYFALLIRSISASVQFLLLSTCLRINSHPQSEHSNYMDLGPEIYFARSAREIVLPPSKPWRRPCQGKTVKVKFVYNRLTGEKGGGQIKSRTTSRKSTRRAWHHGYPHNLLRDLNRKFQTSCSFRYFIHF